MQKENKSYYLNSNIIRLQGCYALSTKSEKKKKSNFFVNCKNEKEKKSCHLNSNYIRLKIAIRISFLCIRIHMTVAKCRTNFSGQFLGMFLGLGEGGGRRGEKLFLSYGFWLSQNLCCSLEIGFLLIYLSLSDSSKTIKVFY